ncbi:MAG: hypothetical protein KAU03_02575 [Candidatus Altiarchaeales archaeon]|nr:hypothetical protein [Candidatus Altiarchaeales archaeon]
MVDHYKREEEVSMNISEAYEKIREFRDWNTLYANETPEQAEILLLTTMFSGAGVMRYFAHGAKKSLVFIKLIKTGNTSTKTTVIAGGTESWLGFDYGRHKRNVDGIFSFLEQTLTQFR